ncbi:MAG TPA: GGDEF domain-containing protein [Capillimicrobium sp.]|nr:GGDEF domain-containing protein [Capillimicrobium sp.]
MTLAARLTGLAIDEERALAGRVAGILWAGSAIPGLVLLILPEPGVPHPAVVVALAVFAVVWSLLSFFVVPWERIGPIYMHGMSVVSLVLIAVAVWATGGSDSPERFLMVFLMVYAGYFFPAREAVPYVAGCAACFAVPLLYDPSARFVAEVIVLVPLLIVLGAIVIAGKTVLVALREHADELAQRDPLTGLANRRALMERLDGAVARGRRDSDAIGLVLLDLDDFKRVNTIWGHQGGDAVLRATAHALASVSREEDVVARLGGDEFAVVVHGADGETAAALCERLVAAVREAHVARDVPGSGTTASAGWACYPADAGSVEGLIALADRSMRSAKAGGKDGVGPSARVARG